MIYKKMLLDNKIAIWDTIASCDIVGSSDASITNVVLLMQGLVLISCLKSAVQRIISKVRESDFRI